MKRKDVMMTVGLSAVLSMFISGFAPNKGIIFIPLLLVVIFILANLNRIDKSYFKEGLIFMIFPVVYYLLLAVTGLLLAMQLTIYYE